MTLRQLSVMHSPAPRSNSRHSSRCISEKCTSPMPETSNFVAMTRDLKYVNLPDMKPSVLSDTTGVMPVRWDELSIPSMESFCSPVRLPRKERDAKCLLCDK